MCFLNSKEDLVRQLVVGRNLTAAQTSDELRRLFPEERGASVSSVRRFCSSHNIRRILTPLQRDVAIARCVAELGPSYGRKMLKGALTSRGIMVGERQIGESLQRVTPHMTAARRTNMPGLHANPVPYLALSFGDKVHMDQNEKLAMYGVTHVAARDGYSGKVVGFATMPRKNNVTIYEDVYRPMVLQYGLWDQVRVDHGREFYLCFAVQEHLSEFRSNTQRTPTVQSPSRMNLVIERLWPEINMRVNYPIKTALNSMVAEDLVSMDNEDDMFTVSTVAMAVASFGSSKFVEAWNEHPLPGKGVPSVLQEANCTAAVIPPHLLPSSDDAVEIYEAAGGHITAPSTFGTDVLANYADLQEARNMEWAVRWPVEGLFQQLAS